MFARILMAVAVGLLFATPTFAADPAEKPEVVEALITTLFNEDVNIDPDPNIRFGLNDLTLAQILEKLALQNAITFTFNEESFKAIEIPDIKEKKLNIAAIRLRSLKLHQFLTRALESVGATYIIKGGTIEIVTPAHAAKVAKVAVSKNEEGVAELPYPLVSVIVKEKPLSEAAALLSERYDLNVVVSPQAGDAKKLFVTARLLNVSAERAVEVLAVQNDLRVVRKGNVFLVTSADHAKKLAVEELEAERQKIEMKKLRATVAPKPKPQPQPEPKPEK